MRRSPSIVPQKMAQAMNSFPIVAAPLFILMGNLLSAARITDRLGPTMLDDQPQLLLARAGRDADETRPGVPSH